MKAILAEETAQQIKLGNNPVRFTVDGRDGKKIDNIKYRASVLFGNQLTAMAMRAAEFELAASINKYTTANTGKLSDTSGSWSWFLRKGSARKGKLSPVDESESPLLGLCAVCNGRREGSLEVVQGDDEDQHQEREGHSPDGVYGSRGQKDCQARSI
jgi:hypothetical protein